MTSTNGFTQWIYSTFIIMIFVLFPCMASAAIIRVPTILLPTIQKGIDAAGDGDTVLVANGTYTLGEDLDFKGKAITVQSEGGADNCIIDGNNNWLVFFTHGEDHGSVFKGFTLVNCERSENLLHYGSISASSSSPNIIDCTINGYGIFFMSSSHPVITGCTFNTTDSNTAIAIDNDNPATITDCIVTDNGGGDLVAGGIRSKRQATITRCTVSRNTCGDAISRTSHHSELLTITDCTVTDNDGKGINVTGPGAITGCTITTNTGDGIHAPGSGPLTISDCTVTNNGGRGINLYFESSATITDCTISQNAGTGIYCYGYHHASSSGSLTIKNCIIREQP